MPYNTVVPSDISEVGKVMCSLKRGPINKILIFNDFIVSFLAFSILPSTYLSLLHVLVPNKL